MSTSNSTASTVRAGDVFDGWTVLRESGSLDIRGEKLWLCRCSCGRERRISPRSLQTGTSTKCRLCIWAQLSAEMVGRRFGKRVVVEMVPRKTDLWKCRCDCGQVANVGGGALRFGASASCIRCRKHAYGAVKHDLTGRRFGMWTVLRLEGHGASRTRMWRCRCECGHEAVFASGYLGSITTAGCRDCKAKRMMRVAEGALWERFKVGAKKRGHEFSLDRHETFALLRQQEHKCALTGLPICIATGRAANMHGATTASLDRIDSAKGYTHDNVWWVHKDVNRMKWTLPVERFIEICCRVSTMHPGESRE